MGVSRAQPLAHFALEGSAALLCMAFEGCDTVPSFGSSLSYLCGPVATMAPHLRCDILCRHLKVCTEISGPRLCPDPWCVGTSQASLIPFLGPLPTLFWSPDQTALSIWQLLHIYGRPCVCPSSGSTELLALSSKGRLITCSLDLNSEAPVPAKMSIANAGQKIKELLSDIGDVSER